jgi:hypothetical protein
MVLAWLPVRFGEAAVKALVWDDVEVIPTIVFEGLDADEKEDLWQFCPQI